MEKSNISQILSNQSIAHNMYLMAIDSRTIADNGKPGQFIHIKIPADNSLLLRRPISINSIDRDRGIVYIAYQVVGKGTHILSMLKKGDKLDVLGPLGNGFSIPYEADNIVLVGGGCGIAPLRYIVDYWTDKTYTSFLGYRDRNSIYQLEIFDKASDKTYLSTDDGSQGEKGFITDILKRERENINSNLIIACGPINMLREVQTFSNEHNVPCQISLEERMGCGIGACMVCSCAVRSKKDLEYKKVCSDGPVFWSDEVILDAKTKSSC